MAHVDATARRLELKIVYWGPSKGGKTTSVRSLHGACDAKSRGELSSVDTEDERTYFFDYAPMNLPRYRDFAIRVNCYTVPGQAEYVETRKRLLRGADGVVFVADSSPSRAEANAASWKQLDAALRGVEGAGASLPLVVAANKQDVTGARSGEDVARRLAESCSSRAFVELVETVAVSGQGIVKCFRSVLSAAVDHALHPASGASGDADRRRFLADLEAHFRGSADGVPLEAAPARRCMIVNRAKGADGEPDAAGLAAAVEASRWLAVRDMDVRDLQRERALSRLLLDLGQICAAATDVDASTADCTPARPGAA